VSDGRAQRVSRELFVSAVVGSLRGMEPWVTDRLAAILEEEDVAAGDRIYAPGDAPDHFYFVRQGRIEIVDDGRVTDTIVGPRAFGMLDALVERPRVRAAYARTPAQLSKIRVDAWLELLEDSFELARASVLALVRAVSALEERLWASNRGRSPVLPPVFEVASAPLDIVERVAVLMRTAPLRGAGVQPLSDLATASEEVTFEAGESVLQRGVPQGRVFVLIDGEVKATRENPAVSWQGGSGRIVCGTAAFGEKGAEWEARAVTRTRALAFGVDDWFDVMEENFEMVRATLAALATAQERLVVELQ
jgi:CRP-like cAMP-binding protein